jgi:hypothetical protein
MALDEGAGREDGVRRRKDVRCGDYRVISP